MPEQSPLITLIGRMKVGQLARLVGLSVDDVAAAVLGAPPSPDQARARRPSAGKAFEGPPETAGVELPEHVGRPTKAVPAAGAPTDGAVRTGTSRPTATGEPSLAVLFGRTTYGELHRAIDRWLLGRVLDEEQGNISHTAERLRISRRTLRKHWERARNLRLDALPASGDHPRAPVPAPPSLAILLAQGHGYMDIRDTVDRWLIGGILDREQGNVSRASRSLGIARKVLRERWARLRP